MNIYKVVAWIIAFRALAPIAVLGFILIAFVAFFLLLFVIDLTAGANF